MGELDGGAGTQRLLGGDAEKPGGLDDEEGSQPLSAAERAMAHRSEQPGRAMDLAGLGLVAQQRIEQGLDGRRRLRQGAGQSRGGGGPFHGTHHHLSRLAA